MARASDDISYDLRWLIKQVMAVIPTSKLPSIRKSFECYDRDGVDCEQVCSTALCFLVVLTTVSVHHELVCTGAMSVSCQRQ